MQKEKVIYMYLEPSDIIIFLDDIDQFIFKLSVIDNFKNELIKNGEYSFSFYNKKVLSPEYLKGEELTNKTNIWNLGIIIYYMSFKEYPYDGKTEYQILKLIESNRNLKKTNDDDLNDLISKMLKINKAERISWDNYFNHSFFKKQFPQEIKNQGNDILLTIKEQVNDIHKNNIDINILKLGYETKIEKLNSEIKNLNKNKKENDEIIKKMKKELDDKIKENNNINRQLRIVTENYQQLKRKYENK
jgi:serine/threonine protein kinase